MAESNLTKKAPRQCIWERAAAIPKFAPLTLILLVPTFARADTMIPLVAPSWIGTVVLILPVVLIEASIYTRRLRIPFARSIWPTMKANLASTLVGIPLVWIVRAVTILGGFSALTQVFPAIAKQDNDWVLYLLEALSGTSLPSSSSSRPAGLLPFFVLILVELVVAFAISIFYENRSLRKSPHFREFDDQVLRRAVILGNSASYGFLIVVIATSVVLYLRNHATGS